MENSSEHNQSLIQLLDKYKNLLLTNSLPWRQKLLLAELSIKDELLNNPSPVIESDKEMLKYTFLGKYIYSQLLNEEK